jgi:glycogen operon protein
LNQRLGAVPTPEGVHFAVWSDAVAELFVQIDGQRFPMQRGPDDIYTAFVPGLRTGARYSLLADARELMDPWALEIDQPWKSLPRAIVRDLPHAVAHRPPRFRPGGLIYEVPVRAFTKLHPAIPGPQRGTLRALLHPEIVAHLQKLRVDAVELMPIQAWIDERHLPPLGLTNGWGYNPMNFFALDPRLAPGGFAELRDVVAGLHASGIGVILDVVFNHTGESDVFGPTLSFRGLAERAYYRHDAQGRLTNESGCGNVFNLEHPVARRLVVDSLRYFVQYAGVDGFRFDLAPILGRTAAGFDSNAPFFRELLGDPLLSDRILIAEPWDVGENGYQLGRFPSPFLEWNDRYRDDVRRFWRGDPGAIGPFVTRIAGSDDIFGDSGKTRTVNYIAAHDGFTLRDVAAYPGKQNKANGEDNRDGAHDNHSWHGRPSDVRALLATLFTSRGAIMLTAGDEFGRTQHGNNNAYAQDNEITWLDWANRDLDLENFTASLATLRAELPQLSDPRFLRPEDVAWLQSDGRPFDLAAWTNPQTAIVTMKLPGISVRYDRSRREVAIVRD